MSEKSQDDPVNKLELHVDIDATPQAVWNALTEGKQIARWFPPEASTSGSGVGSEVTFAWSEQMRWTTKVDAWEPNAMVRWLDDPGPMGEGSRLAAEWRITGKGGTTRVTLVQSAFGESEGWDDFFKGTEVGWTYFLYNLKLYLEKHAGKERHMVAHRFKPSGSRAAVWQRLLASSVIRGARPAAKIGDRVALDLEGTTTPAVVELALEGHALALRMPEWNDAPLFLELEGGGDDFHIGAWLSIYDPAMAQRIEPTAKRTLERLQAALA